MVRPAPGFHLVITAANPLHPDAERGIAEHFGGEVTVVTGASGVALIPTARWGWWVPCGALPAGGAWLTSDGGALVVADSIGELRCVAEAAGIPGEARLIGAPVQVADWPVAEWAGGVSR